MRSEPSDPRRILRALGLTGALTATPVQGGSDTSIWKVEQGDERYALRVFQPGQHEGCERERQVMEAAHRAGLPVPQVHASSDWEDAPVLLLSWMPGRTMAEEMRAQPRRAYQLGVAFGAMQAAIHALPAPLAMRPDAWLDWLGPDERLMRQRLQAATQREGALLHLDYHPLNVMTDGERVTGVLDWQNARAGDPRADAARTASILLVDFIARERPSASEMSVRQALHDGWREEYERQAGPLGEMDLFYAWAGAVMERDLASKRDPEDLARIHAWTTRWKQRLGGP